MSENKRRNGKKRYATNITLPTGQKIYVSASTKEEFDRKIQQAKMEVQAGVDITKVPTFRDYAELWMETYKSPAKLRPTSYALIRHMLDAHVVSYFGDMRLRDVTPMHIHAWMNGLSGYSNSLQSKCIQIVKGIFRTAVDNGLILKSPVTSDVKPCGARTREEEPLTNGQAQALLESLNGTGRSYTFCLIALSTGMRRGEILGLMWSDIDWANGVIHVRHNKAFPQGKSDAPVTEMMKTDAALRDIPLSRPLKRHLAECRLASHSEYVLSTDDGKSLNKNVFRGLWDVVKRRSAKLGFDCHPHLLRHTFITMMFEAGLDVKQVQYLAGHTMPDMTLRVYTHYRRKSREQETADKVSAAVSCFG